MIQAVITDVTRMRRPNVCVAGLYQATPIRLDSPQPTEQWLSSVGGLRPGDVVSLNWRPARSVVRPHSEDGEWDPSTFSRVSQLSEDELTEELSTAAYSRVREAFGTPWFHAGNGNAAFRPGRGSRSLASVIVSQVRPYPYREGIRVDFADSQDSWAMAPLEDLMVRRHQSSCRTCSSRLAALLAGEFEGTQALLRVGLARQFQAGGHPSACYLQVNHIFLIPSRRKHFA